MIPMPRKIFEDADGLRLKALMTAYPSTAITTDGPMTAMNMTVKIKNVSANIGYPLLSFGCRFLLDDLFGRHHGLCGFFHQDRAFIRVKPDNAGFNRNAFPLI